MRHLSRKYLYLIKSTLKVQKNICIPTDSQVGTQGKVSLLIQFMTRLSSKVRNHVRMWMDKLKTYVKDVRENLVPACQEHFSSWRSGEEGSSGSHEDIDFGSIRVRMMEKIAEGGYSCVFVGEPVEGFQPGGVRGSSSTSQRYAIKRIACGGRDQMDEAMKEIDVMKRLEHPNILAIRGHAVVPCRGPGPASEHVYMLFDMYDGNVWDVVQSRVQVGRPLRSEEIRSICRQLCLALKEMHAHNLCHRDVKPHNIMLKDVCRYPYGKWSDVSEAPAVLMDFGSVTPGVVVISDRRSALQTQENAERYTTAPYRAPELWDVPSSCTIDTKVDVWAVGCVLYYCIVGETPFERSSNEAGGSLMLSILKYVVILLLSRLHGYIHHPFL